MPTTPGRCDTIACENRSGFELPLSMLLATTGALLVMGITAALNHSTDADRAASTTAATCVLVVVPALAVAIAAGAFVRGKPARRGPR